MIRNHSVKKLLSLGAAALILVAAGIGVVACGDQTSPTQPGAKNKVSVGTPGGAPTMTLREAVRAYQSTVPLTSQDYLKDTLTTGTLTAVRDGNGQVTSWDVSIDGTHFEEPVDYDGVIASQVFVPGLPLLSWIPDDSELLPAYDEFLPLTVDPDAIQYMDDVSATIDAPLSGTTWASYLVTRGIGRGTPIGGIHPVPAKPGIFEAERTLTVTVQDPATGKPLGRSDAETLLRGRGWSETEIDDFLDGRPVGPEHPIHRVGKDDGLTVTLSASVTVEVSVPPFVTVEVTGTATLSGPASEYAEIADKVADMATDLANKLAEKIEGQLEKLKELIDDLIDDFIDWVAELLDDFSLGDLFGWF